MKRDPEVALLPEAAPEAHASARHLQRRLRRGRSHPRMGDARHDAMKPLAVAVALLHCFRRIGVRSGSGRGGRVRARWSSPRTDLRAGPGISHRVIHRAKRGDVPDPNPRNVRLPARGAFAGRPHRLYVLGDTVDAVAPSTTTLRCAEQAGLSSHPPALEDANGGLALRRHLRRSRLPGGAAPCSRAGHRVQTVRRSRAHARRT
jgi:hypothetical protein